MLAQRQLFALTVLLIFAVIPLVSATASPPNPLTTSIVQPQLSEPQTFFVGSHSLGSATTATFSPTAVSTIGSSSGSFGTFSGVFYNDGSSIFSQGTAYSLRVSVNTNGGSWGAATNNGTAEIQSYTKGNSISYSLIWRQLNSTYYKLTLQGSANSNGQKITFQVQYENGNSQQFQTAQLQTGTVQQVGNAVYAGQVDSAGRIRGIGFDWSDALCSISRDPNSCFDQLDTASMSVSSLVTVRFKVAQGSFSIDPSTVGTGGVSVEVAADFQRKTFFVNTQYWVCYGDGANWVYRTSTDGTTWSAATTLHAGVVFGLEGSCITDGTYLYYAVTNGDPGTTMYFRRGTANSDGTVTWSAAEQSWTDSPRTFLRPSIAVDSSGYPWVGVGECGIGGCPLAGANGLYAMAYKDTKNDGTWTNAGSPYFQVLSGNTKSADYDVQAVALTAQKMAMIWGNSTCAIQTYSGSTWNAQKLCASNIDGYPFFSAVAEGDNVHIVYQKSDLTVQYDKYTYSGNSMTGDTQVHAALSGSGVAVSIDSANNLFVFWLNSPTANHVYYAVCYEECGSGSTWTTVDWITDSAFTDTSEFSVSQAVYNGAIEVIWEISSSNSVRFATLSLVTQPVKLTVAESGGSTGTFSLSGCSVIQTAIAGDGSTHNVSATPSCSVTITVPSDNPTNRERFYQVPWPTGSTTLAFSTCSTGGGTCSLESSYYHYQLQATFTSSGIGADTTATVVTVNSTAYTQSQLSIAQWWDYNSQASYTFSSPITSASGRYLWSSTSGLSQTLISNTFSVTAGGTVTGVYTAQFDLKIQADDYYDMANALATSEASMNVTFTNSTTRILLAGVNGYMDFGWVNSGVQVYLTGKYDGTVVNGTWHTTLYTVNSPSVYLWKFEYPASITLQASVPSGQATDGTEWNFTGHYVNMNSSAALSTGSVQVYYGSKSNQACTATISASFTVCTATESLAGSSSAYLNATDGYIWTRPATTISYGVTDLGLTDNSPSTWNTGSPAVLSWSYINTASAASTKLIVANSFTQLSLVDPITGFYDYNVTGSYFNASANTFLSGTQSLTIPTSFSGGYTLRLLLYQHLMNGTNVIIDKHDVTISISSPFYQGQGANNVQYLPEDVAFNIDQTSQSEIPQVNQTRTINVTVEVTLMNPAHNLAVTQVSVNVPWVNVTDPPPIVYAGLVTEFPLHLTISPGLNVAPQGWQISITLQGTLDGGILYQPIKYLIIVYPNQPPPPTTVPNNTLDQVAAYGSLAATGISLAVTVLKRKPAH